MSHGAGKVSHGAGKVSHGAGKGSHGAGKVSHGAGKVSYVPGRCTMVPGRCLLSTFYCLISTVCFTSLLHLKLCLISPNLCFMTSRIRDFGNALAFFSDPVPSYIRHKDFFRSPPPLSHLYYPPDLWNRLDWRAPVESCPSNIGKLRGMLFFWWILFFFKILGVCQKKWFFWYLRFLTFKKKRF